MAMLELEIVFCAIRNFISSHPLHQNWVAEKDAMNNTVVIHRVVRESLDPGDVLQSKLETLLQDGGRPLPDSSPSLVVEALPSSVTPDNIKSEVNVDDWNLIPSTDLGPGSKVEVESDGIKKSAVNSWLEREPGSDDESVCTKSKTATRGGRNSDQKHLAPSRPMDSVERIPEDMVNSSELDDDSKDVILPTKRTSKGRPPPKQRGAPIFIRKSKISYKGTLEKDEDFVISKVQGKKKKLKGTKEKGKTAQGKNGPSTTPSTRKRRCTVERKNPELYEVEPSEDGLFHCLLCPSNFKSKSYFVTHVDKQHIEHECGVCLKKFQNRPKFQSHRDKVHNDGKGGLACPHCKSRFYLKQYLDEHIKELHSETSPLEKMREKDCPHCGSKFKTQTLLVKHCRQNHPDEIFDCAACERSFQSETSYAAHVRRSHSDDTNFKRSCPHCIKTFPTERMLFYHVDVVHPELSLDVDKPFECTLLHCAKRFRDEKSAKQHSLFHEKLSKTVDKKLLRKNYYEKITDEEESFGEEDCFQCPTCGKLIKTKNQQRHQEQHQEETCQTCGKKFPKNRLGSHIEKRHKSYRIKCPFDGCQKMVQTILLKVHIKTVHQGKRHQCEQCDKSFSMRSDLQQHIKGTHEGIKSPCSVCDKDFNRASDRNRHEREVHSFDRNKQK